ncbi:TIGR02281 family clan AA aspartic protease [Breoghania sp.]|uniref:TIGR02281 family clan AA aspartic protease n=1 Tax=Breoghania sp. TaxID=2065378 RepID=UPI002AAB1293|nr:TIGR02281 family clan AA aspartic protease [Breoghania sp.]
MQRFIFILVVIVFAALAGPTLMQWGVEALPNDDAAAARSAEKPAYRPSGRGTVILGAGRNGHFSTTARINNRFVDVLVDTGATAVALPYEEAVRLGMRPGNSDFTIEISTANGIQKSAPVLLSEVRIDTIRVYDVPALIAPRGALSTTLLGMSFLRQLKNVEMRGNELVMQQ